MKSRFMILVLPLILAMSIGSMAQTVNGTKTGKVAKKETQSVEVKSEVTETSKEVQQVGKNSGLEIFIQPGVAIYSDALGYDGSLGVKSDLGWFGVNNFAKDFVLGLSGLWHGVFKDDITIMNYGGYALIGYQFCLGNYIKDIPWYGNFRFLVEGRGGAVYQKNDSTTTDNGICYYTAPALIIDLKIQESPVRVGLETSYNYYIGDENLSSVSAGLFISYQF